MKIFFIIVCLYNLLLFSPNTSGLVKSHMSLSGRKEERRGGGVGGVRKKQSTKCGKSIINCQLHVVCISHVSRCVCAAVMWAGLLEHTDRRELDYTNAHVGPSVHGENKSLLDCSPC